MNNSALAPVVRPLLAAALAIALAPGAGCAAPRGPAALVPRAAVRASAGFQHKIVNGSPDAADAAVGLLTIYPAEPRGTLHTECTGSVVGSQLVLTAAHCLLAHDAEGTDQEALAGAQSMSFHLGAGGPGGQGAEAADDFQITGIYLPGGAAFDLAAFVANVRAGRVNDNDIALLALDHAAAVQPLAVLVAPLVAESIGAPLHVVGYGSHGPAGTSGDGSRQATSLRIVSYDPATFQAGSATSGTCSGDSGGPALWGDTIVGLTQAGRVEDGRCVGDTYFTRLDTFAPFLTGP